MFPYLFTNTVMTLNCSPAARFNTQNEFEDWLLNAKPFKITHNSQTYGASYVRAIVNFLRVQEVRLSS